MVDTRRPGCAVARRLLKKHETGSVEIAVTSRLHNDIPPGALWEQIQDLPIVAAARLPSPARVDWSTVGGPDAVADDDLSQEAQTLMKLLFPMADPMSTKHHSRIADVDHLLAHKMSGRDVFITSDKAILNRARQLEQTQGIRVSTAIAFLDEDVTDES